MALSRVQSLGQLHLWCLQRDAIRASPRIAEQYARLHAHATLTAELVASAPARECVRVLLPMARAADV